MTACAIEPPSTGEDDGAPGTGCAITADGAYAARLAPAGDCWFPERWTLDGPEPYAVPLPGNQPEEPGTEVQPLSDGRVLIHRRTARRHLFALLYPTGPGTGELPLGAVECPEPGTRLTLLPPAPGGARAYALAVGPRSSAVWLVAGGAFGPERLVEVPGRCSGGVWLDRAGRLLALDRGSADGPVKTVVVDLERAEVSPLLQIAAGSTDRLLLADPDSGLLLISSDAPSPGQERLGWGVLGSTLPVRFPESLRVPDCAVTPFAIQPEQVLTPENCAVALRVEGPFGDWVGIWRPAGRQVSCLPAPEGWLAGAGLWTRDGVLRLPCATEETPCGVVELTAPGETGGTESAGSRTTAAPGGTGGPGEPGAAGLEGPVRDGTATGTPKASRQPTEPDPPEPGERRDSEAGERRTWEPGDRKASEPGERWGAEPGDRKASEPGERWGAEPGDRKASGPWERWGAEPGERGASEAAERWGSEAGERKASEAAERWGVGAADRRSAEAADRWSAEAADRRGAEAGERRGAEAADRPGAAATDRWSAEAANRWSAEASERQNAEAADRRNAAAGERRSVGAVDRRGAEAANRWSAEARERQNAEAADRRSAEAANRWGAEAGERRSAEAANRRGAGAADQRGAEAAHQPGAAATDRWSAEAANRWSAEAGERRSAEAADRRTAEATERQNTEAANRQSAEAAERPEADAVDRWAPDTVVDRAVPDVLRAEVPEAVVARPVPLQQAPLGRLVTN